MLALAPVKKSTALLQTSITFVPSLRLSCFFVLTAAEFDRLSKKISHIEVFAHLVAWCCVDCRRFLACFCLYKLNRGGYFVYLMQDDTAAGSKAVHTPSVAAPMTDGILWGKLRLGSFVLFHLRSDPKSYVRMCIAVR